MQSYKPELPEVLPTGTIKVADEPHRYKTFQGDSGVLEEREYTLEKAPINSVLEVDGISSNESITFEEGTDYELSDDNERIVWQDDPADRPDAGTTFYVTYLSESILVRYSEASSEELQSIDEALTEIIKSKSVDYATGNDLDQMGKLFGDLGKRRTRSDDEYRAFLKSIVQAFSGRGSIDGLKTAIAAGIGTTTDNITIKEDFVNNEYTIRIDNVDTGFLSGAINDMAELADPSGVTLSSPPVIVIDGDTIYINGGPTVVVATIIGLGDEDSLLGGDWELGEGLIGTSPGMTPLAGRHAAGNLVSGLDEVLPYADEVIASGDTLTVSGLDYDADDLLLNGTLDLNGNTAYVNGAISGSGTIRGNGEITDYYG